MVTPSPRSPSFVRLREVIDDDLPIFFAQQADPDASRMAAFPSRDREAFAAHWSSIRRDPTVAIRTIVVGQQVAGSVLSWRPGEKRLVGYWIGKAYWGQGVATAALGEFLQLIAERPLFAYVAAHNVGSIRVLEKCGFTRCGGAAAPQGAVEGAEEYEFVLDAKRDP